MNENLPGPSGLQKPILFHSRARQMVELAKQSYAGMKVSK